jgi:hypothetical protein
MLSHDCEGAVINNYHKKGEDGIGDATNQLMSTTTATTTGKRGVKMIR